MSYNYITDSHTNAVYKTTSPEGAKLIQRYMNQVGGDRIKRFSYPPVKELLKWELWQSQNGLKPYPTARMGPKHIKQITGANKRDWDLGMGGRGDWDLWVGRDAQWMAWVRINWNRSLKKHEGARSLGLRIYGLTEMRSDWRKRFDYSFLTDDQKMAMDKNMEITDHIKRNSRWSDSRTPGSPKWSHIEMLKRYQEVLHNSPEYKSMLIALDTHGEVLLNASAARIEEERLRHEEQQRVEEEQQRVEEEQRFEEQQRVEEEQQRVEEEQRFEEQQRVEEEQRRVHNVRRVGERGTDAAQQAWESSDEAAKSASEVVAKVAGDAATAALDKEFGPNTTVYNAGGHDLTASRTLARLDSLIWAVRNSSLMAQRFSKLT